MPFRAKAVRKISEIPASDWNRVFPDVPENYAFFRTLDESDFDQFSFFYIIVYDGGTPVGAAACFLTDYSLDTSISGPLRRITNRAKKLMPGIFSLKVLVCGIPMGQGRIGISGEEEPVLKAILRCMERLARKNRAAIIAFKDLGKSYARMSDFLLRSGFKKFESLPTTEMDVRFRDFEEYLKTLSGSTRYDLRRKFKKAEETVNIDLEITGELDDGQLADVYRLYLNTVEKHELGFEVVPPGFFKNISKNMQQNARFFLWKIDGRIVAFLLGLLSKDLFIDYYMGLDYSVALKYHLYFLKFRDTMKWCISNNVKKYEMGITGYEPKKRLGFDFIPLYLYVKLRNRVFRPLFDAVCPLLKFDNFDPILKQMTHED